MEDMNIDKMRNQIAILKEKLEKQEIVNDRMIHQVINTKTNEMKRIMWKSIISGLVVIIISPIVFHRNAGASWAFVIATDIMMLYSIVRELLFKRQVFDNQALMSANLLYVAENMKNFKRSYKRYEISHIPIGVAWVAWLIVEVYKNNPILRTYLISGMIVGLCIGIVLGIKMYFRIQNNANDIIRQIEE